MWITCNTLTVEIFENNFETITNTNEMILFYFHRSFGDARSSSNAGINQ